MKLAVIGGDGIGPEVVAEALKVLHAVRDDIETTEYDLGACRYLRNGELLTDDDLASLREHDAILLGCDRCPRGGSPGCPRTRAAAEDAFRVGSPRESAAVEVVPNRHVSAGEPG